MGVAGHLRSLRQQGVASNGLGPDLGRFQGERTTREVTN